MRDPRLLRAVTTDDVDVFCAGVVPLIRSGAGGKCDGPWHCCVLWHGRRDAVRHFPDTSVLRAIAQPT
jgi:hypothetical protein